MSNRQRAKRERARQEMVGGLTSYERGYIRRKMRECGAAPEAVEEAVAKTSIYGFAWFRREAGQPGLLERMTAGDGIPDERWFFYH
jgi:hypothetical protein